MKVIVELDLNKPKTKSNSIPLTNDTIDYVLKFCFLQLGVIVFIVLVGLLVCYFRK